MELWVSKDLKAKNPNCGTSFLVTRADKLRTGQTSRIVTRKMTDRFIFNTSSTASDLGKKLKEARTRELPAGTDLKISLTVLANTCHTVSRERHLYLPPLQQHCPDLWESSFDQWEFELGNLESNAYRRRSDYTLLLLSSTRLIFERNRTPREFALHLKGLLTQYKKATGSEIILVLPESIEGFDQSSLSFHRSVRGFKMQMQSELVDVAQLVDIDPLIMEFGFDRWHPGKYMIAAKMCCHPNCFPLYGNYLANYVLSLVRRNPTRLVITDLDNTLWQGVVGDLGWEGVGLDKDSSGYPFIMLQYYLRSLKEAGVLLAELLPSKNSFQNAKDVFDHRREMILKFDDFVAHEINWDPKSENISRILKDLNLTSTGVMFLDDSEFEREEVQK